jgi:hypothetical protein
VLPSRFPIASPYTPTTIPVYSPPSAPYIPGRMATTQTLAQDPRLNYLCGGYQQSALRDYMSVNDCGQSVNRPGENALYLPINFISHLRGHRSDDEELFQTPGSSKLILSNSPKKVEPEKLTQGLFFGANARILARMIPNPSSEIFYYLDYLRKIGDLLINYTSSSVYLLDHEHRFEVLEIGKNWNEIDATLSLNILKKKEQNVGLSASKVGLSTPGSPSANKSEKKSMVICWQFNQPNGCQYGSNCKFRHICNIEACGASHPAFKHVFRGQNTSTGSQKAIEP